MIALVTGATSGIGKSTAKIFAKNGYDVIITGRRDERLTELKKELESNYSVKVYTLTFDVRKLSEVEKAINGLPSELKKIDVLVNNAGFGYIRTLEQA